MLRRMKPSTLRCGQHVLDLSKPIVMGILNATPDSFYPGSRITSEIETVINTAGQMIEEGCQILDVGGMSSRPGAEEIPLEVELRRVLPVVEALHEHHPEVVISIDTYRAPVAEQCIAAGATMVNDISGGILDPAMIDLVAKEKVAYVIMHMRGTPDSMQENTEYQSLVPDILKYFTERIGVMHKAGIQEIVIDPGFGFSKTMQQNYQLVDQLGVFGFLNLPVLIGVSRKSTLSRTIGRPVEDTLEATTALHMAALLNGASVLRVHDVQAAMDAIAVFDQLASVNTLNMKRLSAK